MSAQSRQSSIEQIENTGGENEPDRVVKFGRGLTKACFLRAIVDAEDGAKPQNRLPAVIRFGRRYIFGFGASLMIRKGGRWRWPRRRRGRPP